MNRNATAARWFHRRHFVVVMIGALVAAGVATSAFASFGGISAAGQPSNHASSGGRVTARIARCQRAHRLICDRRAYAADRHDFPLAARRRAPIKSQTAGLMTEQQVLATYGWTNATVGASMMTYGQAGDRYPDLTGLSSAAVQPSREVWVVTRYHNPPVSESAQFGFGPPQAAQGSIGVRAYTVVVDASTGTETDACQGCATIPAQ